ncbi:MAG: hypothetical protein MUF46_01880 [Desulfobacterales bacterium]|jgi:hypothetical protein|nr:hypothetical protein [Desulfobacterales bacterium]
MEPVIFPRPITTVARTERVTRAKASDRQGRERTFHQHLHPPGAETEAPEEPEEASAAAPGTEPPAEPRPDAAGAPAPKLINIRV